MMKQQVAPAAPAPAPAATAPDRPDLLLDSNATSLTQDMHAPGPEASGEVPDAVPAPLPPTIRDQL